MGFFTQAEVDDVKRAMARERARDRRERARLAKQPWSFQTPGAKMAKFIKGDAQLISSLRTVSKKGVEIKGGSDPSQVIDFRKQLLLSWLDAMSMIRSRMLEPDRFTVKRSGDRFIEFVSEECGWKDCHRVSIPVLIKCIEVRRRAGKPVPPVGLMRHLKKEARRFVGRSEPVRAWEIDPYISDMLKLRNRPAKGSTEDIVIKQNELVRLLYGLRNSRVHQMRNQGEGVEAFIDPDTDEPVYMTFGNDEDLHLVFPEAFIRKLVETGAESLERLCYMRNQNPYDFLPDNSTWTLRDWTPNKVWKKTRPAK